MNEGKMGAVRNMSKNLREEGSKRGEVCQEFEDLSEGQNSLLESIILSSCFLVFLLFSFLCYRLYKPRLLFPLPQTLSLTTSEVCSYCCPILRVLICY